MLTPFFSYGWALTPERLAVAAAVTLGFAMLACALHGVNRSGAFAGGLACFALFVGIGPGAFATLSALFIMTWLSTRLGYRRKQELGLAERREGRNASQVLANLAVPAAGALAFGVTGNNVWVLFAVAALAEAATDTVASETGQARQHDARMITTWRRVPAGTDGGITISGTIAGLVSGVMIAAFASATSILPRSEMWIPVVAGFVGMLGDSLLGATVQRRGWISNRGVNFIGTLAAGALAYAIRRLGY